MPEYLEQQQQHPGAGPTRHSSIDTSQLPRIRTSLSMTADLAAAAGPVSAAAAGGVSLGAAQQGGVTSSLPGDLAGLLGKGGLMSVLVRAAEANPVAALLAALVLLLAVMNLVLVAVVLLLVGRRRLAPAV